eukprot:gb/GECG01005373.1/.p1 GENE.gb/GECG01005373.1/~~gb/GECG01005373.1/.p1  ORF type:complete len:317 (+),score=30.34 gb/GECG01005373.1/:1-951(+)
MENRTLFLAARSYYQSDNADQQERLMTARIPLSSRRSIPQTLFCAGINPPSIEYSTVNIVRMLPDITNAVPRCRDAISELPGWRGNATQGYFFGRRMDEAPLWSDDSHDPSLAVIRFAPSTFMSRPGSPILDSDGNLVGLVLRGDTKIHDAIDLTATDSAARVKVMLEEQGSKKCLSKPVSPSDFGCFYHFRPHEQTAVVDAVSRGSVAEAKGIQPGDRITHVDGTAVRSSYELSKRLKEYLVSKRRCKLRVERLSNPVNPPLCSVDFHAIELARDSVDAVVQRRDERPSFDAGYKNKLEQLYGSRETHTVYIAVD